MMVPGFSSSRKLTSVILQLIGALMSAALLTDSTAPMASPALTALFFSGSST